MAQSRAVSSASWWKSHRHTKYTRALCPVRAQDFLEPEPGLERLPGSQGRVGLSPRGRL